MFWPYTIDTLQSERGLISGPEPVFFTGWDDQTFPFKQLFSGLKYVCSALLSEYTLLNIKVNVNEKGKVWRIRRTPMSVFYLNSTGPR